MTSITIELPDEVARNAQKAGLLDKQVLADLLTYASQEAEANQLRFESEIRESLAAADSPAAVWLSHAEIASEWAAERAALLSGRPLDPV